MAVLLIQMPFFPVYTPSLGLSLLKASLETAGIECRLEYFNVEFAARLGADRYAWIAERAPSDVLLGDQIFASCLNDSRADADCLQSLIDRSERPCPSRLPPEIVSRFQQLVATAQLFLEERLHATEWNRYELVGISTPFQIAPALALARRIKSLSEPPRIILGGSYCQGSLAEDLHRTFSCVDYVCRGDGEQLIVSLARGLADCSLEPQRISGLIWRDGAATRCNNPRGRSRAASFHPRASRTTTRGSVDDNPPGAGPSDHPLDRLPLPRYDDWLEQIGAFGIVDPDQMMLPIETSRGCWYGQKRQCTFCGLNDERIAFRRKSPERVLGEFRGLCRYGVQQVYAVDSVLDRRFFHELLPALADLDHELKIHYCTRANLTREQVGLLRESGVVCIQPGIESLSTPTLRLMRKGVTALQNVRLLRDAAEVGLGTIWNLMYGFPGESPTEYTAMAALIPALSHLQPPCRDRSPLWIQRFSPLFQRWQTAGLRDVAPVPAYYHVLPIDREAVAPLAYFFTYRYGAHPHPDGYVEPVVEAITRWRAEHDRAAFISFGRGDVLHLADTRQVAAQPRAELRGLRRRLYEACRRGASLGALARGLGTSTGELERILESFVHLKWVALLDDRFLSLAVPMDGRLPAGMPLALRERVLIGSYVARMARLAQGHWLHERFKGPPRRGPRRLRATPGSSVTRQRDAGIKRTEVTACLPNK